MDGNERQTTKSESRSQFSNWEKIFLHFSSLMLGVTATLLPLLPRTTHAQEKPPVTRPHVPASEQAEIPDASFPFDIGLQRLATRELPTAYLNQLRTFVAESISTAMTSETAFMTTVATAEGTKQVATPLTEASTAFLKNSTPEQQLALQAVIEYFISTFMVKSNVFSTTNAEGVTTPLDVFSLSEENYEEILINRLKQESVYWSPEMTSKFAFFVLSALQKAEAQSDYLYHGESSQNPARAGEEPLELLQAKAELYPTRLVLAYQAALLANKQLPLAEPGSTQAAEYEQQIFKVLFFIATVSNEELLRRISESQGEAPFLSPEHLTKFTDDLHGLANGSLFPEVIYDASAVAKSSLKEQWRFMELRKAGESEKYWREVMRQQTRFFLENLN